MAIDDDAIDTERLVLVDLLNHVLDKGVVISGNVTISVADVDLLMLDLRVVLTSIQSAVRHGVHRAARELASGGGSGDGRDDA